MFNINLKKHLQSFVTLSGLNLDLLCIQQLNAVPFCKNCAKLYFDAKHLQNGLNRGVVKCLVLFLANMGHFLIS